MAYFPFFVDLKGKSGLIVGGGTIALHKIIRLLPYESSLTVISKQFSDEILQLNHGEQMRIQSDKNEHFKNTSGGTSTDGSLTLIQREFCDSDIDGKLFVIAATADSELNAHIYDICTQKGILVNVVDDRERCGFMFPSLVKKGKLSIGISTEGASPRIASVYRKRLESEIPDKIEPVLTYLDSKREYVKAAVDDEKIRAKIFSELADWCMANLAIPEDGFLENLLKEFSCENACVDADKGL